MGAVALLEREASLARVAALLARLRSGHGGALFVIGEAGLGKTALLDEARRLAPPDVGVGFGQGDAMETAVPFGLMGQALRVLDGAHAQSAAASAARADRFYSVFRQLESGRGRPLLICLDDLHWADPDSLALVSFLSRRLGTLGVAVVATLRPWPPAADAMAGELVHAGVAEVERLSPLADASAAAILGSGADRPLGDDVVRAGVHLCAGNPLLLQQVGEALRHGERLPEALDRGASPSSGIALLLSRFAGLPEPGMRVAQGGSVFGAHFHPDLAVELIRLDDADADAALSALGRSGLVRPASGGQVQFVHPLFRQALYEDLPAPMRTRLHARAFDMLCRRGLETEAAEHAIRAGLVGDARAIDLLETVGLQARQSGAVAAAVAHLDAAVDLSGDVAPARLRLELAEALTTAGQLDRATSVYEGLRGDERLPWAQRVEVERMLGRARDLTGAHDRAAIHFADAAAMAESHDPAIAADVLLDAAMTSWLITGPATALPLAARSRQMAPGAGTPTRVQMRAEAAWAFIALQAGDPAGAMALVSADRPIYQDLPGGVGADGGVWGVVNNFAHAAALLEHLDQAEQAFAAGRAVAEEAGAPEAMAILAVGHAFALTRMGRLHQALEAATWAASFGDVLPMLESFTGVAVAYILLHLDRLDESERWCRRVEEVAGSRGEWNALLFVWDVLGHRSLREGRPAEAAAQYARLEASIHRMGIAEPCLPPWGRHAAAAHLAAGDTDAAARLVEWLETCSRPLPCRFPRIAAATGRAGLADHLGDPDGADRSFRAAVALHDEVRLPLEQVETLTAYGAFLRRHGDATRARELLADAVEIAEGTGALWLAGLARDELAVAGGRRRRRQPDQLTAQEQRVARLATGGKSNAELAAQLSVSVNTVETHLRHIYAKLGVRTRGQLTALLARSGDAPDRTP